MRALVADKNETAAERIQAVLEPYNYRVEVAGSGDDALDLAKRYDFDIAVLNDALGDMEGTELVRQMRTANVTTPALILASSNDKQARIKALFAGADDYLLKPVDPDELTARMQAIVRRSKGHATSVIRTGRMAIDLGARTVEIDGKVLHVSPKEYGILELLSLRRGRTLTKEMFLDHLYGGMDEPEQKIIDVFICKLRKKIAKLTEDYDGIETVWGYGYTLKDGTGAGANAGLAEDDLPFDFETPGNGVSELDLLLLDLLPRHD